jgi:hypothetical protein
MIVVGSLEEGVEERQKEESIEDTQVHENSWPLTSGDEHRVNGVNNDQNKLSHLDLGDVLLPPQEGFHGVEGREGIVSVHYRMDS